MFCAYFFLSKLQFKFKFRETPPTAETPFSAVVFNVAFVVFDVAVDLIFSSICVVWSAMRDDVDDNDVNVDTSRQFLTLLQKVKFPFWETNDVAASLQSQIELS